MQKHHARAVPLSVNRSRGTGLALGGSAKSIRQDDDTPMEVRMSRVLMLTDRTQDGIQVFQSAIQLAERLNADEIAAVVTRPQELIVPAGLGVSTPDSGVTSLWIPPLPLGGECQRSDEVKALFQDCHREAVWRGLRCETQRTRLTLLNAAVTVSRLFGLIVIPRAALVDDTGAAIWGRDLCREVDRPLVVTAHDSGEWRRIVVAGHRSAEFYDLMQWGEHWSDQLRLPLLPIELPLHSRTLWPSLRQVRQVLSPTVHRQAVREALDTFGLDTHDVLLVGRRRLFWPDQAGGVSVLPSDLIESPLAAVGILPATFDLTASQLLFASFASFDAPALAQETFAA